MNSAQTFCGWAEPGTVDRVGRRPAVWYVAAGYLLPAGIEAYLLHYATELRNHGFDTRIVVFQPLPKVEHRFLRAVREMGIRIESLFHSVRWQARVLTAVLWGPWVVRGALCLVLGAWRKDRRSGGGGEGVEVRGPEIGSRRSEVGGRGSGFRFQVSGLHAYMLKKLAVRRLKKMIAAEKPPDIIHVKGRIIAEAFGALPAERTIYQHALMGTRDPSWTDAEFQVFSDFLNRIARVLVQGRVIAATFAQSFNIRRPIDVVPTMAPDEFGEQRSEVGGRRTDDVSRRGAESAEGRERGERRPEGGDLRVRRSPKSEGGIPEVGCRMSEDLSQRARRSQRSETEESAANARVARSRRGVLGHGKPDAGGAGHLPGSGRELAAFSASSVCSARGNECGRGSEVRGQRTEVGERRTEDSCQKSEVGSPESVPRTTNKEQGTPNSELRTGASLRFGIICRFTEQKGIKYILEALTAFSERRGQVNFTFAGQGPLDGMIREWIRSQVLEGGNLRPEGGDQRSEVGGRRSGKEMSLAEAQRSQREKTMASGTRELRVPGAVSLDMGSQMRTEPGISPAPAVSLRHSPCPLCALREEMSADGGQRSEDGGRRTEDGPYFAQGFGGQGSEDLSQRSQRTETEKSATNARDARSWRVAHGERELGDLRGLGERAGSEGGEPRTTHQSPSTNNHELRTPNRSSVSDVKVVPVSSAVDVLKELDVFVHPGLDDAMPVSIVEALMCGVPCITTTVGAAQEIVRDGVEGCLVEPASSSAILGAMERCAAWSPEDILAFRARARARYEEVCLPEKVGAQVAGIYRQVIDCAGLNDLSERRKMRGVSLAEAQRSQREVRMAP